MDRQALLTDFNAKVDLFAKFQGYIEKAKSQQGRFSSRVVEKVIADNEAKREEVVGEIMLVSGDMDQVILELSADKDAVLKTRASSAFELEELELRLAIGDLEPEEFETLAADLKEAVAEVDGKVATIDAELGEFESSLARWMEFALEHGLLAEPEPEPEP
ncbi:MAG: hypothetical protein JXX28_10325, partial [Deltaproteobacteria bacterium]|nr:hypothetical protein [Deltaproteobacteria bacterium]